MIKKIITGALILVMLGTSQVIGYADYKSVSHYAYAVNPHQSPIEIISPKGDIIIQDNLLISVQVFDHASVILRIYKLDTGKLIVGPDRVDQGENLKFYTKLLKGLLPGKYRMIFNIKDRYGNNKEPIIKNFTVKNKDIEMNKSLGNIPKLNVTDILKQLIN
jgi:hypothetical protein